MIKEVFVPVRDYEGIYEISNYGNVRSLERVVMRSDGIARRVSAKNLVSFKGTCLARDGEKKPTSKPVLTIAAFYPEYNIKRHKLIPKNVDQTEPILNRYTFHVKPRLNPVTIRTPDGGTIRYNNYMELCEDYSINEYTFFDYFYTGNIIHNQDLNGCTIAFDHPFYIRGEYKIVSHLIDVRRTTFNREYNKKAVKIASKKGLRIVMKKDSHMISCSPVSRETIIKYTNQGYEIVELD